MIGKFFHSFDKDSLPKWQGRVLAEPNPGFYLVQLCEWIMGDPSYETISQMRDVYEHKYAAFVQSQTATTETQERKDENTSTSD